MRVLTAPARWPSLAFAQDVGGGVIQVAGGGATYPNRPGAYTNSTEVDFSQTPTSTQVEVAIDGTSWNQIYFGSSWSQSSDATAPQSPPGTFRGLWPLGVHGDPGSGWGIGNVVTHAADHATRLYLSLRCRFEFPNSSYWHAISNKFMNLECNNNSQILMQLREQGSYWRHAEELVSGGTNIYVDGDASAPGEDHIPGVVANPSVPVNQWVRFEVVVDLPGHVFKIWQDGTLTTDAAPNFTATEIRAVGINAFRGGGGETLGADLYYNYDHFFAAW